MAKQAGRKTTTKKAKSKAVANAAPSAAKSPGKHSDHVITIRALDPLNKEIFEASLPRTASWSNSRKNGRTSCVRGRAGLTTSNNANISAVRRWRI